MAAEADNVQSFARWRAAADLYWTSYDDGDDWVVYVPASADIHHLTASAYRLWAMISAGPVASSGELAAKLASALELPLDSELIAATHDTLSFFDQAGLVQEAGS